MTIAIALCPHGLSVCLPACLFACLLACWLNRTTTTAYLSLHRRPPIARAHVLLSTPSPSPSPPSRRVLLQFLHVPTLSPAKDVFRPAQPMNHSRSATRLFLSSLRRLPAARTLSHVGHPHDKGHWRLAAPVRPRSILPTRRPLKSARRRQPPC